MRPRLLIFLLCTGGAISASEEVTKPAPRPRLTEELRREALQDSPTLHEGRAASRSSEATPAAAQHRVIELNHGMVSRTDAPPPESRPFTLREGGTYLERDGKAFTTEMKLQYDASSRGWDLFKMSW
ncbi:MAG TPA: hypothetical protein VN775_10625 [Opitutaceae bacterium]|nr:hypothetical protein [Opitutaceae bacterium]